MQLLEESHHKLGRHTGLSHPHLIWHFPLIILGLIFSLKEGGRTKLEICFLTPFAPVCLFHILSVLLSLEEIVWFFLKVSDWKRNRDL